MALRFLTAILVLLALAGCTPDCSKNYVGALSLSDNAKKWIPAPTERAFSATTQTNVQDSFHISQSTQGPVPFNETNEQACHNFDGQSWVMNCQGDSTGINLIAEVLNNPNRELIRLGINDFALLIDLDDYQIFALDTELENINGEVSVFDTVTIGPRMFFDVIRVNILDPDNHLGFTQFEYAKSVGFVHFLQAPSLEWVRD